MALSYEAKAGALKSAIASVKALSTATRDLSVAELEDIIEKVKQVIAERQQAEIDRANRLKAFEEAFKKIEEIRESSGMSDELLAARYSKVPLSGEKKERKPRKAVVPKYRYTTMDGEEKLWTGQGKTPLPLKERMAADGVTDKEHYRIPAEEIAAMEQQMNS
ncbi:H-NS family nucleoid-associated regulatory protein [Succinimonas sp.]|jgi:DNA-binding protein H-NS|uniref:H-NS family histone-like protein n=2 Tax=Succinimonas sp. TaxID=1936151 RepID=UPI002E843DB1|nr:H-NS histone family protein [Succinimonas sp.]MEE3422004.1 H-NS family nucleoid-associated regulatory protein [Succinimonas sp.]